MVEPSNPVDALLARNYIGWRSDDVQKWLDDVVKLPQYKEKFGKLSRRLTFKKTLELTARF